MIAGKLAPRQSWAAGDSRVHIPAAMFDITRKSYAVPDRAKDKRRQPGCSRGQAVSETSHADWLFTWYMCVA